MVTPLNGQELNAIEERPVKPLRQLQLWEPHPRTVDERTRHDDPIMAVETKATPSPSAQEEERQLQWIHRWLEESIQKRDSNSTARGSCEGIIHPQISHCIKKEMRETKVDGNINEPPT